MEPKIVTRDTFMVVGTEYIGRNENGEIPKMWGEQFIPRIREISNGVEEGVFYGLCSCAGEDVGFSYIAAKEVLGLDAIPQGMVGRTIPAATYAVFTHIGSLENLNRTYEQIHQQWLPESGYERTDSYEFEYYGNRFDILSPASELDIYFPVKPKE